MITSDAVLDLQISFCEAHLAHHIDPSDPKNTPEIRAYIEAQLALARGLLLLEPRVREAKRTKAALSIPFVSAEAAVSYAA